MLTSEAIGKKIKEGREAKKLSQTELSDLLKESDLNMSRETLSKVETGDRNISAIELKAICKILSISIEDLLEEHEDNLVTLFRMTKKVPQTLAEIEELQEFMKGFIYQKKLYSNELILKKKNPAWEA